MPYSVVLNPVTPHHPEDKPILNSHDCGEEFSLVHWMEVCRLVELVEIEDHELKGCIFDDSLVSV